MSPQDTSLLITGVLLVIFLVMLYYYFRVKQELAEMWAVDTYPARELRNMCSDNFKAVVEVEGEVTCDKPIESPALGFPCCYSKTTVERQVTVQQKNYSGYEWRQSCEIIRTAIFKVNDSTGYTLINPEGAEIDLEDDGPVITTRQPWFEHTPNSDSGYYRVTEKFFLPKGHAYVLGEASGCQEAGTNVDVIICRPSQGYTDPGKRFFIISRDSEKELTSSLETNRAIFLWVGVLAFLAFVFSLLATYGIIH